MSDIRKLDNISFTDWFKSHGGSQGSIDRMWDPIGDRRRLHHLHFSAVGELCSPRIIQEHAGLSCHAARHAATLNLL